MKKQIAKISSIILFKHRNMINKFLIAIQTKMKIIMKTKIPIYNKILSSQKKKKNMIRYIKIKFYDLFKFLF